MHSSLRAWKDLVSREEDGLKDKGIEAVVSVSTSTGSSLDNKPISNALDKDWNQFKDWCSKGYKLAKTNLNYYSLERNPQLKGNNH